MTFEDMRSADKALTVLESLRNEHLFDLSDAAVITKDMDGLVSIKETEDVKPKGGAIAGGVAGLVVGTLLGGPIGGALLGAATGAVAGKLIDLGIPDEQIKEVSEAMSIATSALIVEFKSGDRDKLTAAMRESGGELYELTVTDQTKRELQKAVDDHAASEAGAE
jgi:uncharacterized membrane protein